VKTDIPKKEMIHNQDVIVELGIQLQASQQEI
jgi:hypothetical protein